MNTKSVLLKNLILFLTLSSLLMVPVSGLFVGGDNIIFNSSPLIQVEYDSGNETYQFDGNATFMNNINFYDVTYHNEIVLNSRKINGTFDNLSTKIWCSNGNVYGGTGQNFTRAVWSFNGTIGGKIVIPGKTLYTDRPIDIAYGNGTSIEIIGSSLESEIRASSSFVGDYLLRIGQHDNPQTNAVIENIQFNCNNTVDTALQIYCCVWGVFSNLKLLSFTGTALIITGNDFNCNTHQLNFNHVKIYTSWSNIDTNGVQTIIGNNSIVADCKFESVYVTGIDGIGFNITDANKMQLRDCFVGNRATKCFYFSSIDIWKSIYGHTLIDCYGEMQNSPSNAIGIEIEAITRYIQNVLIEHFFAYDADTQILLHNRDNQSTKTVMYTTIRSSRAIINDDDIKIYPNVTDTMICMEGYQGFDSILNTIDDSGTRTMYGFYPFIKNFELRINDTDSPQIVFEENEVNNTRFGLNSSFVYIDFDLDGDGDFADGYNRTMTIHKDHVEINALLNLESIVEPTILNTGDFWINSTTDKPNYYDGSNVYEINMTLLH